MVALFGFRRLFDRVLCAIDVLAASRSYRSPHVTAIDFVLRRIVCEAARRAVLFLGYGPEPGRGCSPRLGEGGLPDSARIAGASEIQPEKLGPDYRARPFHARAYH